MKLFSNNTYRTIVERVFTLAMVVTVIGALVAPRTANAMVGETLKRAFDQFFMIPEQTSFPTSGDRAAIKTLTVAATAYSSDPWQTDATPCLPAMNFDLCEHYKTYGEEESIAANFLPLGTKVRFPDMYGNKIFTVRDRMNKRYNYANIGYYRIDFYMAAVDKQGEIDANTARTKARNFGFKKGLKMEVLGV